MYTGVRAPELPLLGPWARLLSLPALPYTYWQMHRLEKKLDKQPYMYMYKWASIATVLIHLGIHIKLFAVNNFIKVGYFGPVLEPTTMPMILRNKYRVVWSKVIKADFFSSSDCRFMQHISHLRWRHRPKHTLDMISRFGLILFSPCCWCIHNTRYFLIKVQTTEKDRQQNHKFIGGFFWFEWNSEEYIFSDLKYFFNETIWYGMMNLVYSLSEV